MQAQNTNTDTTQDALKWWENHIKDAELRAEWKMMLNHKYYGDYVYTNLTDSEIVSIYLKEVPTPTEKDWDLYPGNEAGSFDHLDEEIEVTGSMVDVDFLMSALNSFWHQANTALERKNLGDIERKNYQLEKNKSKAIMDELEANGLPYKKANAKLKADNDALAIHLKRLLYILECERTKTGIALDLRYQTEYTEAKALINTIEGNNIK